MQLKEYQEKAIEELTGEAKKYLERDMIESIVFESPTGSGKTIMMAEFLVKICSLQEFEDDLSFIWTAPRMLHKQSKKKLADYYEATRDLDCSEFEDLQDRMIRPNEVLFFNWDSINRENNIYIRENERDNNLSSVLERTKKMRKVILIIDESHYGFEAPAVQGVIQDIGPSLIIRVSATPEMLDCPRVKVEIDDVKQEGMIKQGIILNDGFKSEIKGDNIFSDKKLDGRKVVLKEAIKKMKKLRKMYQEKRADINPLLLIQLPDRSQGKDDGLNDIIEVLNSDYRITKDNGKLGIWLDQVKENIDEIEKSNNSVEVLIFKQAIALGWDCPRSHILVLFRKWSSQTFTIQTLGRIMRVADIEKGIYPQSHDDLNYGYVFTDLPKINLDNDIVKSYMVVYKSKRKKIYHPMNVCSWHRIRQREKTRLSPQFQEIFKKQAEEKNLQNDIDVNKNTVQRQAISESEFESPRELQGIQGEYVNVESEKELERIFKIFINEVLKEEPFFYPEERSISNLTLAIYTFFSNKFNINYGNDYKKLVRIILNDDNNAYLKEVIKNAKKAYEDEVKKSNPELSRDLWEVPENISYNQYYQERNVCKSIMKPFYEKTNASTIESKFIEHLEKSDSVKWWFKNGERDAIFFAVPYEQNDREKLFYVDFLVKFDDGRLGFFETKGVDGYGGARESKEKVKALKKHLDSHKKFFGGITIYMNNWKIYNEQGQEYDVDQDSNWVPLVF